MFQIQYTAGDGGSVRMVKVCHHNWAGSPDQDGCHADNDGNCAWIADNEWVVCHHTGFKGPCPLVPSPCRIDGSTCVVMDRRQAVTRTNPIPLSIFNGNSQTGEKPGIQNPPFAFGRSKETALVIMDMWNHHPMIDCQIRVGELAPQIELFAKRLRDQGVLIIHSCSSSDNSQVSGYYNNVLKNDPNSAVAIARRRGKASVSNNAPSNLGGGSTRTRENFYSIDDLRRWDSFFWVVDYETPRGGGQDPTQQHPAIMIEAIDALSADGLDDGESSNLAYQQLLGLTANRPNLIYVGVHTNQCILRRHNGMRTMHRAGKSLWIVRDLTDCVSDPNASQIRHFSQTDMVVDFIGHYLGAETLTTEQAGIYLDPNTKKRFRFIGDDREG